MRFGYGLARRDMRLAGLIFTQVLSSKLLAFHRASAGWLDILSQLIIHIINLFNITQQYAVSAVLGIFAL